MRLPVQGGNLAFQCCYLLPTTCQDGFLPLEHRLLQFCMH